MPTTSTPCSRAACMAKLPQPQPTSSTRMPGSSRSFLQTSSSLANWAASRLESSSEKNAHE